MGRGRRLNWDRVRKEKAIRDYGYEGLEGPPLAEAARLGYRNEMNAADPDGDRGRGQREPTSARHDGKGGRWEIVDPASVRLPRRRPGKKRGQ